MTQGRMITAAALGAILAFGGQSTPAGAQTDYYNTDAGRPLRIEDAHPVERHAFELQLAPLRLERTGGGAYDWDLEPEIAYGILPRTQLEIGFPVHFPDGAGKPRGLGGVEVAALHNLNTETRTLPALAIAAALSLPRGWDRAFPTITGVATRTFPFARFHANAGYTAGAEPAAGEEIGEVSRWLAGVAVDRAIPLRGLLIGADLFAEQPLHDSEPLEWTAEAGLRYQTSPQFNLDLGVGRRLTGDQPGWAFTFGLAHAFAVRSLIPGR